MKVKFYCDITESKTVEVDDNITEDELNALALDWVERNVSACYRVVETERGNNGTGRDSRRNVK